MAFIFEPFRAKLLTIMDSKKLALLCRELAENKKAEQAVILDVRQLSSVTDYFVIVTGTSEPHLRAIADEITKNLRDEHQVRPRAVDGDGRATWQVLDFFDVIVRPTRVRPSVKKSAKKLETN